MTGGVELFRLYQRKTSDGDAAFFGSLGDALVSVTRDRNRRDVWIVTLHNPSQDRSGCTLAPARLTARPADHGDLDQGDFDEGGDDGMDDLPADLLETLKGE
ncbi:hypothetical protein [Bradyrhizobium sp. CCBAU 45384]|uniref:hypothetical protein n=1 Tax=Bradyrhizobium sp. CCBAU 45384 TaxID=858428 RepID=UPI002304D31F|nr:hypothetical protein [Bradyrhizobium sp. CCBAU 45384]MDA9407943.1 hypothetical protein [Bradyrhizobium sp. CCBAU 45384]